MHENLKCLSHSSVGAPGRAVSGASSPPGLAVEQLQLRIGDPVALLNEIADRYQSPERVIMEYIDNALDDAEAWMRESGADAYPGPVKIRIIIDPATRTVRVIDNLRGMPRAVLKRIVENVAQSTKRGNSWLNGRFGFGVHAFRAIGHSIRFRTRHNSDLLYTLQFRRDDFDNISLAPGTDEPLSAELSTGTEVTIGPLTYDAWRDLSVHAIKDCVEQHFEGLLGRKNLSISVELGGVTLNCQVFDYDAVEGIAFQKALVVKERAALVQVNLKVTKTPIAGRKARFFAKGRRISNVKDIPSFISASPNRTRVWWHDHLVGYIEVGDVVEPVLTRDEFKHTANRRALYDEVLKLERDIAAALDQINEAQRDGQMDKLADVLQNVLADISRQDQLTFRSVPRAGTESSGGGNTGGGHAGGGNSGAGGTGGGGSGGGNTGGTNPSGGNAGGGVGGSGRAGFAIRFAHLPEDFDGNMRRSTLIDGVITINIDHPDFREREQKSRQGAFRVTQGLVWYLAGAIAVHYQDELYNRYGRQPERRDQLMAEQFALTCRLEAALRAGTKELELAVNGSEEDAA